MTKDMTVGNPLRLILNFSIPLIFGNLFQQLYNMADSVIVGKTIGLNALTAVGASSAVIFLIVGFTIGACNGLAIPIALHFGAPETIFDDAYRYMVVICLGIPFTFLYITCSGIIRAIRQKVNKKYPRQKKHERRCVKITGNYEISREL